MYYIGSVTHVTYLITIPISDDDFVFVIFFLYKSCTRIYLTKVSGKIIDLVYNNFGKYNPKITNTVNTCEIYNRLSTDGNYSKRTKGT